MKIILIDDDEISLFLSKRVLNKLGFNEDIHQFVSATEALVFLNSISDRAQLPDLIFLDLNMPNIDGFEFMNILRKEGDKYRNVKISILTSSIDDIDIEKSKNYDNVIDFITKPLRISNFDKIFKSIGYSNNLLSN